MRHVPFVMVLGLSLSACGGDTRTQDIRVSSFDDDPILASMEMHASEASEALKQLAAVSQARTPPAIIDEPAELPVELQRKLTIVWSNGPVEPLLRTLAIEVGYAFEVYGRPPVSDVLVNVRADLAPAYRLLKDIGLQVGDKATVNVVPHHGVIELRYETE